MKIGIAFLASIIILWALALREPEKAMMARDYLKERSDAIQEVNSIIRSTEGDLDAATIDHIVNKISTAFIISSAEARGIVSDVINSHAAQLKHENSLIN